VLGRPVVAVAKAVARPEALVTAAAAPELSLVFVDVASGATRSERTIVLPDIIVSQYLPFFDQYAHSHEIWSPASDAVVLPLADSSGVSRITIVPADGSPPRPIADGVEAFWSP
jgi:TolB protein